MLETLCVLFYTGYFKWADGSYNAVPQNTQSIEVKTQEFRALLFKTGDKLWFGIIDGQIFYGSLPRYKDYICKLSTKEKIDYPLTPRSIIEE